MPILPPPLEVLREDRILILPFSSDVLHPNRANVSKDELRQKLAELYKANKDQVSCFGFRTQYGGGKSTGFALIYESHEAMKKFEPHYRLVRYGAAAKIEKASRQQRTYTLSYLVRWEATLGHGTWWWGAYADCVGMDREATQEPSQDCTGDGQGEGGGIEGQEEVREAGFVLARACSEGKGGAYLCIPIQCSRTPWRIWNTRSSSYDLMIVAVHRLNDSINLSNNLLKMPTKPRKRLKLLFPYLAI